MFFNSTRGSERGIYPSEAMIKGIAVDGGLYVPDGIPCIEWKLEDLMNMDYGAVACFIMKKYFSDFENDEIAECVNSAYDDNFDTTDIVPMVEKVGVHFLELYHGPTLAFKDMALTILPHLLKKAMSKRKIEKELVILTATSGDTGKAALEGFANVEGIRIIVFYPENGVSEIQKRQMITQEGSNTCVIGIKGNFDDAQSGVKDIFNDDEFVKELHENGFMLSSANSINIGRLIPQVVYYFYGYLNLLRNKKIQSGETVNVVVPTGNFGNILSAYYAKKMGLPIGKLICASNENNVLYDFLSTGIYDRRRELKLTNSPSMDILISSNLERLLYEISGRDEILVKELMEKLKLEGKYIITEKMKEELKDFYGGYASEAETEEAINKVYRAADYVMDTHTAVAYSVYEQYKAKTGDNTKTIIASTASPFKFGKTVSKAVGIHIDDLDDFRIIEALSKTVHNDIPQSVRTLENKMVIHNNTCKKEEMKLAVQKFLNR